MTIRPTGDLEGALAAFGVQAGPQEGDEVPIRSRTARIGRGPSNDVVIDDDSISGSHARLDWDTGARAWRLTDLGSTNGTFVEGVRLAVHVPTPLPFGTSVRFGAVRLHFRAAYVDDSVGQAPAVAPPPVAPAAGASPAGVPPTRRAAQLRTGAVVGGVLLAAALAIFGIRELVQAGGTGGAAQAAAAKVEAEKETEPAGPQRPMPAEPTPADEPIRIPPPVELDFD